MPPTATQGHLLQGVFPDCPGAWAPPFLQVAAAFPVARLGQPLSSCLVLLPPSSRPTNCLGLSPCGTRDAFDIGDSNIYKEVFSLDTCSLLGALVVQLGLRRNMRHDLPTHTESAWGDRRERR